MPITVMLTFVCPGGGFLNGSPWQEVVPPLFKSRVKEVAFSCQVQHPQASGNQENILQCYLGTLAEVLERVR